MPNSHINALGHFDSLPDARLQAITMVPSPQMTEGASVTFARMDYAHFLP